MPDAAPVTMIFRPSSFLFLSSLLLP